MNEGVRGALGLPHPYYDRQGNKISHFKWSDLFESKEYQIVKQDRFGEFFVSTVWLGLNHAFFGEKLLIFETMVFWDGDGDDVYMDRYETEQEALQGHQIAIDMVKNGEFNEKPG